MFRETAASLLILSTLGAAAGRAASVDLASRIDPPPAPQTAAGGGGLAFFFAPPSVSADGRYAVFLSGAANLAPGQQDVNGAADNGSLDVFLADLVAGSVTLVSHAMGLPATTGNDGSSLARISADGRWVLFRSAATDLAPGQSGPSIYLQKEDVLLYDRVTGNVTLVATTRQEQIDFYDLDLSADGRYVTFATEATDLIPGQGPGDFGVYLYDRVAGSTRLVTHLPGSPLTGSQQGGSSLPRISADGRYVAFLSYAPDLLPGQISENGTAVLWDRVADTLTAVGPAEDVNLSADGKIVAFTYAGQLQLWSRDTHATLVVGPGGGHDGSTSQPLYALSADGRYTVYFGEGMRVYDRVGRTSLELKPASPDDGSVYGTPQISADGRFVTFMSSSSTWVSGQIDPNAGRGEGSLDVFVYDLNARKALLVSHRDGSLKTTGNVESEQPAISANGSRVVYYSDATDLVAGVTDTNATWDVFAFDVPSQVNRVASLRAPDLPTLSDTAVSRAAALSPDGTIVAFERHATVYSLQADLFLYDAASRSTVLVDHVPSSPTTPAKGISLAPAFSGDGRWVAFLSNSRNLVPGANPAGTPAWYLFDRVTGTVAYVARAGSSFSFSPDSGPFLPAPSLSGDGRWMAFVSSDPDVVPGQQEPRPDASTQDVFLFDRQTGAITLVSHAAGNPALAGDFDSQAPLLSADGRYLAFLSGALNLLPGLSREPIAGAGAYLYDRVTGSLTLLNHRRSTPLTVALLYSRLSMSADGRYVAFGTAAGDLDPSVPDSGDSIYIYDRVTASYQRVGSSSYSQQPVALSADGRTLAFTGYLDDGPFFYDRVTRTTSQLAGASVADGELALSADGRYVVFAEDDSRRVVVPGLIRLPGWEGNDLYLYDRTSGTATLVNQWWGSAVTTGGYADGPLISADGHAVAFTSQIDLVEGDYNRQSDAYLFSLSGGSAGGGGPVTLPPCILFDTRRSTDGPALRSNVARVVKATGLCGVPATAHRVTVKATAFQGTGKGNVRFYPGDLSQPSTGILRFSPGQTAAATFDLPLAPGAGTLTLLPFVAGNGTAGVSVEVDGYTP